jgi:phosphate transport system permease protein
MSKKLTGDNIFKILAAVLAASAAVILIINAYTLITGSALVLQEFKINFLTGKNWNPVVGRESFGVLPYILGTLITSGIALIVGVPLSLGIAIFLVEMAPKAVKVPLAYLVELLAAVPSVIYGLWACLFFALGLNYIEIP